MKKLLSLFILCSLVLSLSSCRSVSSKMYNEISDYVTENLHTLSPAGKNQFYNYKTTGLSIGGVYYGYYYSSENKFLLPDFYSGTDFVKIQNDMHKDNGGVFFGRPNNGTDWCFIKKISENWFYYELHWA